MHRYDLWRNSNHQKSGEVMLKFVRIICILAVMLVGSFAFLTPHAHAAPAYTVNVTSDESDASAGDGICETTNVGECTLRAAIEEANAYVGSDTIEFEIPGSGVHTITPNTQLPAITDMVVIDGYSQSGASANTADMPEPMNGTILIELNGANIGDTNQQAALALISDDITVKGLSIFGFSVPKSDLSSVNLVTVGSRSKIQGCYIGVRADGFTVGPDQRDSVGIMSNGTDALIGGEQAADRNVFFSQSTVLQSSGIFVNTGSAQVYGNYIGLAADGVTDLSPEPADPLQLAPPYNLGINSVNDASTQIGGTSQLRQNIISGNEVNVALSSNANEDRVQGNKIGTDYAGNIDPAITNGYGVVSTISDNNLVGGINAGEGNLIAGNSGAAVGVADVVSDSDGSPIGGAERMAVLGNQIYRNQVYDFQSYGNANLGIDLFRYRINLTLSGFEIMGLPNLGPTPNDAGDADSGANSYINRPILKTAQQIGNQLTITYDLDVAGSPSDEYRVEFFANDESTIFGAGPGQNFLGAATNVAPGNGKTVTLTVNDSVYKKALSATTTSVDGSTASGYGSTSEFSQNISIGSGADFDADGVGDTIENAAPNGGDGNNDGTADRLQPTVSSYEIDGTGIFETFVTTGCSENGTVSSIEANTLAAQDVGKAYPYGLTDFSLNCSRGDTVNVTKYVFVDDQPSEYVLRKFNEVTDTFRDVPGSTISAQTIGSAAALVSTYSITDGGELDDDGLANGIIVDPVGLATTQSLAQTGENMWWGVLILMLFGSIGGVSLRRYGLL